MSTPTEIANRVVPEYETLKTQGGLTGRVAERWAIAYEAAELALRPAADSDGWIEHDGKSDPDLAPGTLVTFRCRDGYEDNEPAPFEGLCSTCNGNGNWSRSWWVHTGTNNDITHYRVVQP